MANTACDVMMSPWLPLAVRGDSVVSSYLLCPRRNVRSPSGSATGLAQRHHMIMMVIVQMSVYIGNPLNADPRDSAIGVDHFET